MGVVPDDKTVERVIDHVILPAVGMSPGRHQLALPKKARNS